MFFFLILCRCFLLIFDFFFLFEVSFSYRNLEMFVDSNPFFLFEWFSVRVHINALILFVIGICFEQLLIL